MFCMFDVPVDSIDFHVEPCGDIRSKSSERLSPLLIVPMLNVSLCGRPLAGACAYGNGKYSLTDLGPGESFVTEMALVKG